MTFVVSRTRVLTLTLVAACVAPQQEPAAEQQVSAAITARGSRVLAMDIGAGPGETREAAVASARSAGITTVVLNYDWNELEPQPFQYQNTKLLADNAFYSTSPHEMSVVLNIRPIAGPCRTVPPDLAGLAWSDPVMITRFSYLLSWIRGHLTHVNVQLMSVGTEVDSHLAPADYADYKVFFEAARQNAKDRWGAGLPVGSAITWGTLVTPGPEQAAALDLAEHADRVLMTYYGIRGDLTVKDPFAGPIEDIFAAFRAIDGDPKTRGRTLDLIEVGYPTSSALHSSELHQQIFVSTMFGISDAYAPRLQTMVFTWQTDQSDFVAQLISIGAWGGGGCQAPAGTPPAAPAAPTITPPGEAGDRTWQYYVVAVNAAGNSFPGPIATITNGPPALSATSPNRLTWPAVTGATHYKVLRYSSGGVPADTGLIAVTSATALDDPGLPSSTFTFQEYIRTLGYRTHASPAIDKLGLGQIATEAHARGW